jgi:type I restriction enzyme, S subunit
LDSRYFGLFFQTKEYRDFVSEASAGVNINNLKRDHFAQINLPIPPLTEQTRIACHVEGLLLRIDSARNHLSRVPAILKRFRQSVLAAACSGKLTEDWRARHPNERPALSGITNQIPVAVKTRRGVPEKVECPDDLIDLALPDSWRLVSVAELLRVGTLKDLKDGNHGSNHPKTSELGKEGLPFITATQVKNYGIDYEAAPKISGAPLKRLQIGFAQIGDVILTHKGTVGRAAVCTKPCVLTPQTTYYRCESHTLLSEYLVYLFTSPFFYSQLAAVMSQTTRDFVPISEQYRMFFIIPPPHEQREIARRVDALFAVADKVQNSTDRAKQRVSRMTQSILAKAFRGELVPTEAELARREGRDYEHASALLERIRKQREAESSSKNSKSRRTKKASLAAAKG